MQTPFHPNGHLTEEALCALVRQDPLDELTRLECSEHLSYCDTCLQRYTALLTDDTLLLPRSSCRKTLWTRVRQRAAKLFFSRYSTAVAAVALALSMVWGSIKLPDRTTFPTRPAWSDSIFRHRSHSFPLSKFPDHSEGPVHQGGRHP